MDQTKGVIYDIQRFSVHDGPGIRTIVFLKGCPLRCDWCSNPESQSIHTELMGKKIVGEDITVEEVITKVLRDKVFYDESSGGMTLSGGEPLMQDEFAKALVVKAKENGINVAIETSLYQSWNKLWNVLEHVDHVLFDIKIMNTDLHKEYTNVENGLIVENIKKLVRKKKDLIPRVPLIPGYTDGWENLFEISSLCVELGIKKIELLPYHRLGESKYEKLKKDYALKGIPQMRKDEALKIATQISENFDIEVIVV